MTKNIENKVVNYYDRVKRIVGASVLGALFFAGGYGLGMNNIPSNKNERIPTRNYSEVSKNDLEKKTERLDSIRDGKKESSYKIVVESIRGNEKSVDDLVNSRKELTEDEIEKELEKTMQRYKDVLVYVPDENYKHGELRIKVDKLSEKEKSEYLSMKGTKYDVKNGYISFSDNFEDKEFYESIKELALLSEFGNRKEISDEEKRFIGENAPGVYKTLFLFEEEIGNELERKVEISDKKETKKEKSKGRFVLETVLGKLIESYLHANAETIRNVYEEEIRGIDIVSGLRKEGYSGEKVYKKLEDINEAPKAPGKNDGFQIKRKIKKEDKKLEDEYAPPAPRP